ncbi:helix-turn-helix domain-containing protein [Clostridium sp. SHJSY1]|uniref:GH39 family glycosyl hydrolase n=1 Tax=Clostridium sp. SHJSY1 TaxID=2942483 RepID=UPI002874D87D|nr:helix-turn-helix domain-containing protein [Clostridium sp. SHJSY1]MDS0526688.1 helix-turn-helix domain-containing protein [Clostridium sp. SHJSY1]
MNFKFINYTNGLPFSISIVPVTNEEYHSHKELELVFILKGTVSYFVKGEKYKLSEHDLFWVNSLDIHSFFSESENSLLLILHLDKVFFDTYYKNFSDFYYKYTDSINDRNNPFYDLISSNLANLMLSMVKLESDYKLRAINNVIEIVLVLINNFKEENQKNMNSSFYKNTRLYDILKFIENNYSSNLSLNLLSEEMHISPQYISKFFKENLEIGFVDYINKLRITKSLHDLIENDKNILDIAMEHGFNDHKAYNRAFKKEFNMTATEYKKKHRIEQKTKDSLTHNYFNDNSHSYFKYLFEFLDKAQSNTNINSSIQTNINIDLEKSYKNTYTKYWSKITSIGRASLCLRHEIRRQIELAQKDIGYEFIRFHGIFSDDMMVYKEDSKGNPIYNWSYIDEIFDFFYRVNLKPFIEIGFMPEILGSKKQYAFLWHANMSYPKSLKKWTDLISAFIKHCIDRYGLKEVTKWYFQVWNAPDLSEIFWYGSTEKFYQLFKSTYFTIKSISKDIKVGSPGLLPKNEFKWADDFLNYCQSNFIELDFMACNVYAYTDLKNTSLPSSIINKSNDMLTLSGQDFLEDSVIKMKELLKKYYLNIPIIVTEWNLSPFTNDYNRDTCFFSSYITYNILNNINNIDALTFWSLSDIIEEGITEDKLYHGGLGLITYNRLKKPSYNAFSLLSKLGNTLIEKGNDYIITASNSSYQILLFNFIYFDDLFKNGDKSLLEYHNRYNIFKNSNINKEVHLIFSVASGIYKIKRWSLNRTSGSTFDAWLNMGVPEQITPDVYDYLKSKEIPEIKVSEKEVKNELLLTDSIPPHGILLIEIDKIK